MIPESRRSTWVHEDFPDESDEELLHELSKSFRSLKVDWSSRKTSKRLYSHYRRLGFSELRAEFAAYGKATMPGLKRKRAQGIGKTYRAKKVKANYGATPSFNRALVKAVERVEKKSHETFYTNFGITWDANVGSSNAGTHNPGGFQALDGAVGGTWQNQAMRNGTTVHAIQIPGQIEVGTSTGYRRGQHVQPQGFQWWMAGYLMNYVCNHTFHLVLVRSKGHYKAPSTYPGKVSHDSLGLFENGSFGSKAGTFKTNFTEAVSASRFDRDQWDVKKHWKFTVNPLPEPVISVGYPNNGTQPPGTVLGARRTFKNTGYFKFKEKDWDFSSSAGGSLKNGDYHMFVWQEGYEENTSGNLNHLIQLNMELSFKDA